MVSLNNLKAKIFSSGLLTAISLFNSETGTHSSDVCSDSSDSVSKPISYNRPKQL